MSLFHGLLVIDCASYIAAPAAATMLGEFGARVIKVEEPGRGDSYRRLVEVTPGGPHPNFYWMLDNRSKEGLALDLKDPESREAFDELLRRADVLITNYPGHIRERLRLTAGDVRAINPRLVYASLTPYGEDGPERNRTAFDATAWWARTGLMASVRPTADQEPSAGTPGMGDHPTAVSLFAAIVMALYRRERTGEGGEVSTSLFANGLWANAALVQATLAGAKLQPKLPRGRRNPIAEHYRCRDGRWLVLVTLNPPREFPLLLDAIGRPEWFDDPRFATHEARMANSELMVRELDAIFAREDLAWWRQRLEAADVTFGHIGLTSELAGDPQVVANGFLPEFADNRNLQTVEGPVRVAGLDKRAPTMAPALGQDTRTILTELGLDRRRIDALIRRGAAQEPG